MLIHSVDTRFCLEQSIEIPDCQIASHVTNTVIFHRNPDRVYAFFLSSLFLFLLVFLHTQYGIHAIRRHCDISIPGPRICYVSGWHRECAPAVFALWQFCRCFSQCYSYREFKNKKGGSLNASRHFNFPHLNPSSTHSIICTRTLSNLSAKTNDVDFCMIITHVACSLAFLPFLFVFYLRLSTLGDAIKGAMSFSSQKGNRR